MPAAATTQLESGQRPGLEAATTQFEISFQSFFWKCKGIKFDSKTIKKIAEPVAAMAVRGWHLQLGLVAAKFLEQSHHKQGCPSLVAFDSISDISRI